MTDSVSRETHMTCPDTLSGRRYDVFADDDRELLSDALGHLWATCPRRRAELVDFAKRTGILLNVSARCVPATAGSTRWASYEVEVLP